MSISPQRANGKKEGRREESLLLRLKQLRTVVIEGEGQPEVTAFVVVRVGLYRGEEGRGARRGEMS